MTRFFFIFLLVVASNSFAQDKEWVIFTKGNEWFTEDITILNKKRRNLLLVSQATLFTGSLLALDRLWYDDYSRSSFHFIKSHNMSYRTYQIHLESVVDSHDLYYSYMPWKLTLTTY